MPLTKGQWALIDACHWSLIEPYKWRAKKSRQDHTFYAYTDIRAGGSKTTLKMHRLILGVTDPKIQVDHIDHNGLNNLDSNLRLATNRQNQSDLRMKHRMTGKHTGVCWDNHKKKWRAAIKINGRTRFLGNFDIGEEERARDAYLTALAELGETLL